MRSIPVPAAASLDLVRRCRLILHKPVIDVDGSAADRLAG